MARPAEFDQYQALDSAMQLFWRKGYAGTSIRDLTDATSLQPGSLYAAFKSKRTLFLQSLDHFFSGLHAQVITVLDTSEPPLQRIHIFFDQLVEQLEQDEEVKGCLLINTLLEIPAEDDEITQRVSSMFKKIEHEFSVVLKEAIQNGELTSEKDPEKLARLLITGIFGLRVYNRMDPTDQSLRGIVDDLLSVLASTD